MTPGDGLSLIVGLLLLVVVLWPNGPLDPGG